MASCLGCYFFGSRLGWDGMGLGGGGSCHKSFLRSLYASAMQHKYFSCPLLSVGAWIMDFHLVSGNRIDSWTSTWPPASAHITDFSMDSSGRTDHGHQYSSLLQQMDTITALASSKANLFILSATTTTFKKPGPQTLGMS